MLIKPDLIRSKLSSTVAARLSAKQQQQLEQGATFLKQFAWLKYPLFIFVLSRVIFLIVGYVAEIALPSQTGEGFWQISSQNILLDIWARWDSGYYLNIVQDGYFFRPGEKSTVAFFPLYPLMVDLLNSLLNNPVLSGVIVSNINFIGSLIFLYKLTKLEFNEETAKRSVLYLCLFPTSFFFSSVYTESTFLLFALASMYFAKKGRWGWAGIAGMLVASSRIVGVVMWGVIGLEWLKKHGWTLSTVHKRAAWQGFLSGVRTDWKSLVALSATPLGLLSYIFFLNQTFTDPIAFWTVQEAWGRESLGTVAIFYRDFKGLLSQELVTGQGDIWWHVVFDSASFFLSVIASFFIWRRLGASYALYVLLSAIIPSLSSTQSLMRYILVMFPIFMILGHWGRNTKLHQGILSIFPALAALFFALFVNWYFVA